MKKLPALLDRFLSVFDEKAPERGFTHGLAFPRGPTCPCYSSPLQARLWGALPSRRQRVAEQVSQVEALVELTQATRSLWLPVGVERFWRHLFLRVRVSYSFGISSLECVTLFEGIHLGTDQEGSGRGTRVSDAGAHSTSPDIGRWRKFD